MSARNNANPNALTRWFRRGFGWQSRVGRYTFPKHAVYSSLDGIWQGVMTTSLLAYICIDQFKLVGDDAELVSVALAWFPSLLMLTAPFWDRPFGRSPRYWLFCGLTSRVLAGFALAIASAPWEVVAIVAIVSVLTSGVSPLQNSIYATNYKPREREQAHGYAKMLHIVAVVAANLGLSMWLEINPTAYRIALPLAGIVAAIGMMAIAAVRIRPRPKVEGLESGRFRRAPRPWEKAWADDERSPSQSIRTLMPSPVSPARMGFEGVLAPYRRTMRLFRRHPNFAIFELGFMLYGCAFMMLMPIIPTFSKNVLNLNYRELSVMTTVVFFGVPFVIHGLLRGMLSGVSAPMGSRLAFGMVLLFPLLMLAVQATESFPLALFAFAAFGAAMVFVDYAWNFGPIKFAGLRDPMPFVSAHAMMVGLRALIAFPAAYQVKKLTPEGDYTLNLWIPAVLLMLAVASTFWLSSRMKSRPDPG